MEQQRQTEQAHVKISYKQYLIDFLLQQDLFEVNVINEITLEQYSQAITQEYIISREDFKNLFETPEDLFFYLISNQHMISFDQKGQLKFQIKLVGKNKKSRTQIININKKQQTQIQLILLRHQKLRKEFKEYAHQKEKQIAILKTNLQELQESKSSLFLFREKMIRLRLNTHTDSSDEEQFILSYEGNSVQIILKERQLSENKDQSQFSFINCYPILPKTKQAYHLTILQGNNENLSIGFISYKAFDQQEVGDDRIILKQSQIFNEGLCQQIDEQFGKDDIITCTIQLSGQRSVIEWNKNGFKFAESTVSETLKKKALYLCIIFKDRASKVAIKVQDFIV